MLPAAVADDDNDSELVSVWFSTVKWYSTNTTQVSKWLELMQVYRCSLSRTPPDVMTVQA